MARIILKQSHARERLRSDLSATRRNSPERLFVVVALLFGAAALAEEPPTTTAPTTTTAATQPVGATDPAQTPIELRYTVVPRTPDDVARILAELDEEINTVAPTTQPATSQPTTQPEGELEAQLDGWRLECWKTIQEFRSQLVELGRQVKALDALDEDAIVAKITETIAEYQAKTAELQALRVPDEITDQMVEEARALYDQHNQAIDALSAALTQQESLLREGFAAQRTRLTEELRAVQSRRERVESTLDVDLRAADSDAAREIIRLRRRVTALRAATLETTRVIIELKERITQQEVEQNKLRRDAYQPYVVALRLRMNTLVEERSRSRAERLKSRIESPDLSPVQRAAYRLELMRDEHIAALQRDYANAIKDRFPTSALATRESMSKRDKSYWKEFSASLSRRSPAEVLSAYQEADDTLTRARQELAGLESLLDKSLMEDRVLEDKLRKALSEFDEVASEFQKLTLDRTDEESIRLKNRVAQFRPILRKSFEDIIKDEQELIERLRQGIEIAKSNVALWEVAVSRLYWAHLFTRGPTILEPNAFYIVASELQEVSQGLLKDALTNVVNIMKHRLTVVSMVDWYLFGFAVLAIGYASYWLLRKCFRIRREAIEETAGDTVIEESVPAPRFSLRLRFHLARVGVVIVPLLIMPALAVAFILSMDLKGTPAKLGYGLAMLIGGAAVGIGLVNAAFKAPKPRYRLIPCSRTVARYYRRFGYALVILAFLFLGSAGILDALELAASARRQLVNSFVFVATLVGLIFFVRRETVLNVFPRTERGRFAGTVTFLRAIHPFLVIIFVLLVVMHPLGYRAMAVYITVGLTSTLGLILLAWTLHQLVKELVYWIVRRTRETQARYAPAAPGDTAGPPQAGAAATDQPPAVPAPEAAASPHSSQIMQQLPASGRAVVTMIRWLLIVSVSLSALSVWGVRPHDVKRLLDMTLWQSGENPITLWRIGGAVLALMLMIIFSRGLRQTLQARVYPNHPTIDRGAQAAINTLLHYATIAIGIYIGLQTLQIDFGALVVLFGGLGLGIGLGLQSLIVNFISGLLMLFERHVKVGDVVIVHDKLGEVTKVSMRSTTIRTPDGIFLIIPNGEFINQKVENWTLENKPIRGAVDVGVSYGADPRRVKDLLLEIAFAEPKVRMDPAPDVQFVDFGDSSLNFKLVCWFNNPGERWAGMLSMRYTIVERFRENGIEIPFPQRTLSFTGNPFQIQSVSLPSAPEATPTEPPEPRQNA